MRQHSRFSLRLYVFNRILNSKLQCRINHRVPVRHKILPPKILNEAGPATTLKINSSGANTFPQAGLFGYVVVTHP